MGLFSFIKGQLIEVIEWLDESGDTLIWKFPDSDKEIKSGAQLVVRESQAAIFMNEGQMGDIYGPGRHELVTRNMPLLTTLKSWKYGFDSPFKCDIYYVNTKQFINQKWGTRQPIMVSDPDFPLVQLRAFGTFNFKIADPAKFFRTFAGTRSSISADEVTEALRSAVVTEFSSALKKSGKTLVEINMRANELGDELLPIIKGDFEEQGLEITKFFVENVSLPPEIQAELTQQDMDFRRRKREGAINNQNELENLMGKAQISQQIGDMNKFMQFQMGSGMNPQGGPQPGQGGDANNMMANMMQMGMGMNMANQMMGNMNQQQQQQTPQQQAPAPQQSKEEVMASLKQLGELRDAGILTPEEFEAKKKDLLSRL